MTDRYADLRAVANQPISKIRQTDGVTVQGSDLRALLADYDRLSTAAQMLADWAEHEVGAEPDLAPGLAEVRAALAQEQGESDAQGH